MAVNPNIKKKADDIRNKVYGKEVRESLASGLEAMSSDVVETVGRQDEVEGQFQSVIENTTDKDVISAPEIIAARDGEANLKARLDKENQEVAAQLAQTVRVNPTMSQTEIQSILNENTTIEFLDGTYDITINQSTGVGLNIPSNRNINFRPNATLKVVPNNLDRYVVLHIYDVSNVKIFNPTIIGDRNEHTGTTGERGAGFEIRESSDVFISNPKIKDCWGDGIYINVKVGSNITVNSPIIDNCRRNGISIISGTNVTINEPLITNINGTDPQAGIDIEPNSSADKLDNIIVNNPITKNCEVVGITLNMFNIVDSGKFIDITINNHSDVESGTGFTIVRTKGINGHIKVNNLVTKDNSYTGFLMRDCSFDSVKTTLKKPTVINSSKYGITITKETNDTYSTYIGNVDIIEPTVIGNPEYSIYVRDNNLVPVKNVNIINPLVLQGQKLLWFQGSGVIEDERKLLENKELAGTIRINDYKTTFDNKSMGTLATFNIGARFYKDSPELTFTVHNNNGIAVYPYTDETISVINEVANKGITSNQIGASITLVKITDEIWTPKNIIGNWEPVV